MFLLLLFGIRQVARSNEILSCRDPAESFPVGTKITGCTNDAYKAGSTCKFTCDADYQSSNPEKQKTVIACGCVAWACSWTQKAEITCQKTCRKQTALYPKLNYYFKVLRDFSTESDMIGQEIDAILVQIRSAVKHF